MEKGMPGWNMSIRTSLLPKHTNQHGTIFGGVILSLLDMAGAIEAKRFCAQEVVTVAMKEVVFKKPVGVGDLVSFYTRITDFGHTSISTEIGVIAIRDDALRSRVQVTNAHVTYVTIDRHRNAAPIHFQISEEDPPAMTEQCRKKFEAEM